MAPATRCRGRNRLRSHFGHWHSAGAYLTLISGSAATPRPAALVSMAGYGRLSVDEFSEPSQHYVSSHERAEEERVLAVLYNTVVESPFRRAARLTQCNGTRVGDCSTCSCAKAALGCARSAAVGPDDLEWLREYEPLFNISSAYPPTMLLHGPHDTDVSFEQSLRLQRALTCHGVPNELLSDENWSHVFVYDFDKSVEEAFDRTILFLQKYT